MWLTARKSCHVALIWWSHDLHGAVCDRYLPGGSPDVLVDLVTADHFTAEQYQQQDGRWTVVCGCGATFTESGRDGALARQEGHWNVERLRLLIDKEGGTSQ